MHMIMENFRRFADDLEEDITPNDTKVYLFESDLSAPTSETTLDDLLEEYTKGNIEEELLFERWQTSMDYEYITSLNEASLMDVINKPIDAFANSQVAIAAKSKARSTIFKWAAKLFVGLVKIIRGVLNKAGGLEQKLVATVSVASGGQIDQKTVAKIYESSVKLVTAGVKKLTATIMSFISNMYGFF